MEAFLQGTAKSCAVLEYFITSAVKCEVLNVALSQTKANISHMRIHHL